MERERERERERDWCRHVKVKIASADRQVERGREIEGERDVCVLFEFRQFVFFTPETRLRISKFCVDLCTQKKSDRTRCLAVSILEYNLGPKITGSEVQ